MSGVNTPFCCVPLQGNFIGATTINTERINRGGTSEPPSNKTYDFACPTIEDLNVDEDVVVPDAGRPDGHVCSICLRSFTSQIGLGVHKKKQHPVEYNEEINIARVKPRWSK